MISADFWKTSRKSSRSNDDEGAAGSISRTSLIRKWDCGTVGLWTTVSSQILNWLRHVSCDPSVILGKIKDWFWHVWRSWNQRPWTNHGSISTKCPLQLTIGFCGLTHLTRWTLNLRAGNHYNQYVRTQCITADEICSSAHVIQHRLYHDDQTDPCEDEDNDDIANEAKENPSGSCWQKERRN